MNCWNCKNHRAIVTTDHHLINCVKHENVMDREGTCKDWGIHEAWDYRGVYPHIFGTQEEING